MWRKYLLNYYCSQAKLFILKIIFLMVFYIRSKKSSCDTLMTRLSCIIWMCWQNMSTDCFRLSFFDLRFFDQIFVDRIFVDILFVDLKPIVTLFFFNFQFLCQVFQTQLSFKFEKVIFFKLFCQKKVIKIPAKNQILRKVLTLSWK